MDGALYLQAGDSELMQSASMHPLRVIAIAWALEKCHIFVMGCPKVIVVTDHQPITGIFGDRDLSKVHNPCLFRLKEKYLRYSFNIQHCPGKWHKGADVIS